MKIIQIYVEETLIQHKRWELLHFSHCNNSKEYHSEVPLFRSHIDIETTYEKLPVRTVKQLTRIFLPFIFQAETVLGVLYWNIRCNKSIKKYSNFQNHRLTGMHSTVILFAVERNSLMVQQ